MKFEHKNKNKNKNINLPIPLLSGLICSAGIIFSPLLVMNYFCDGVYFDKFIDKYDIKIQRFHQYDGKDNKYAFPSIIILNIKSNENNEDKNEDDEKNN